MYFSRTKRKIFSALSAVLVFSIIVAGLFLSSGYLHTSLCHSTVAGRIELLCGTVLSQAWDLFYHLGGNGPWIPRAPEGGSALPRNCVVDQAHMVSRHAERYPTRNAGARQLALLRRLQNPELKLKGQLSFVSTWQYFTNISDPSFENLTNTGPFAGTSQAFKSGQKLRGLYADLVRRDMTTEFWSCDAGRDIETARFFADGFFGPDWESNHNARLNVIPETLERGADTLTPGVTCLEYRRDSNAGHDQGYSKLSTWQEIFTAPIAKRLEHDAGGLLFSSLEIYSMMELCGFEILARGSSPWCKIFTHKEWLDFEYARDLLHFYRAGPGNKYAATLGWLWLNATTSLLTSPDAEGVYFSFVHDGDIAPILTTLGILDEVSASLPLPSDRRLVNRRWRTSDVLPMGGRLLIERVTCNNTGLGQNLRRSYIRLFLNDGIVDLAKSMLGGGLANAVGLKQWTDTIQRKTSYFGNFLKTCGLDHNAPDRITFLKPQYQEEGQK